MFSHESLPTIDALLARLHSGELSPLQALDQQRSRFASLAQTLGCVIRFQDEALQMGLPYSGVAVANKDIFAQDGWMPGLGRDRGHRSPGAVLAAAPAALRAQGMVQLGTLAMAEDACSATAYTRNLPTPTNPLAANLAVGGSSSGSAVAVASGMVYASLGTDTSGSVRIPAMTCGVMGLKTTHQLIDRQGMSLVSPSLDSIGVLARSVQDLTHVYRILGGRKAQSSANPLRVSYWDAFTELQEGHAEIGSMVFTCSKQYAGSVRRDIRPLYEVASHHAMVMMSSEVDQTQRARIDAGLACEPVRQLGLLARALPRQVYQESVLQRSALLKHCLDEMFSDTDVWIAPLQMQSLPKTDEVYPGGRSFNVVASLAMHKMCGWINYLGLPALALPIGKDAQGLPISLQLVARPCHELDLLRLAREIQNDLFGTNGILPYVPQQEEVSR